MSKFGKLSRIACAIVDIIICIGLSVSYINKGTPEIVPLFAVIAIGMVIWLFDYTKPTKAEKETKLIAEANKFFDEFIKKQLLNDKQLDKEIANYWS